MPCPICRSFKSAANFSRHTKTAHNMEPSRLFEEYRAEALAMLTDRITSAEEERRVTLQEREQ